jgi:hypothetical protein
MRLVLAALIIPLLGWGAYAAAAWLRFQPARANATGTDTVDGYMPRYEIREVHQVRVAAPVAATWRAAQEMHLQRSPMIGAIFRARALFLRSSRDTLRPMPLVQLLRAIGWGTLAERPGRELVVGSVTQPWQGDVTFRSLPPAEFATFDSAGYVKIVVVFAVDSLGPTESRFRTETRVLATDASSRARFRRYWSVFSPGILLIRWDAIRQVRREAERAL